MERGNALFWGNAADADAMARFHLGLLAAGRTDVPVPLAQGGALINWREKLEGNAQVVEVAEDGWPALVVVGTVRVWCDDRENKPTATAQGTYVLPH